MEEFGPEHTKAHVESMQKLTVGLEPDEIQVINHLADAYNAFVKLYLQHPSDQREFEHGIHVLQQKVMARAAVRAHPEIFNRLM